MEPTPLQYMNGDMAALYHVVRLEADDYSMPRGSVGIVMESCAPNISDAYVVQWIENGTKSVPVYEEHLVGVSRVSFPIHATVSA